jgi:uncharacterized protein YndB with AHSA1/START domain
MATEHAANTDSTHELLITRTLDAPRELVWQAWTDPKHLSRWWGPRGFTASLWEADLRPGGAYRFAMRSDDGIEARNRGVYREVLPPHRLVFEGGWTDAVGNYTSPIMTTVITLEDLGGKTRLTLRGTGFASVLERDRHNGGWSSSLDALADYLASL